MTHKLLVSSSPHLHTPVTTRRIMGDVLIALCPAMVASVVYFGWRALMLLAISVATCVLCEYVSRRVMKREQTIQDLSAVVTGVLLAMNVPSSLNPLELMFGDLIAIVVVKQMFGGIGQNFVNPALAARIILLNSFPGDMASWPVPFAADASTSATPLGILSEGGTYTPDYLQLFLGNRGGSLGETCALALLLGFIYLLARKVIAPTIPLIYVGTVAVLSFLMGRDVLVDLLCGGLLLGAIFMATDYTTSPITTKGKVIYAIGCGCLTMLIRNFGSLPEGVSYAIVVMNILTPLIERATRPHAFGVPRKKEKEAAKQ